MCAIESYCTFMLVTKCTIWPCTWIESNKCHLCRRRTPICVEDEHFTHFTCSFIYMVQYATFQDFWIWVGPNGFYSGFSTELSFNLIVKRKDVLESQMVRLFFTWKIMTRGRGYLPGLLRFILTFKKKYLSTSDQNYHILKGVSVKTKVVIRN